jgi:hypothetical protein
MKKIQGAILIAMMGLFTAGLYAQQDVGSELKKLGTVNAPRYVGPLMAGWGAGLNSGFFHSADLHDVLGFDLQVKMTLAGLSDEDKTYKFETPVIPGFTRGDNVAANGYPAEITANSVVGKKETTELRSNGGTLLMTLPGGLDLPAAPLIVPQVAIGLPFGLEVMGRFLPTTKLGDAGKVNFVGFGLRHDIDQYIPLIPVDIAVHFMTQKFNYEDGAGQKLISASGTAFGLEASKGLLFLTLYGGFQIESSSWDVGPYDATFSVAGTPQTVHVSQFTVEGKNKSRLMVGVRLLLAVINVHADYSVATTPVVTLGAGITFR